MTGQPEEMQLSDVGRVQKVTEEGGWLFHDLHFTDGSPFVSRRRSFPVAYSDALSAMAEGTISRG